MMMDGADTIRPQAVFLHSSWRSASTYVWAKFRSLPDTRCYYQPLHEQLATMTPAAVGSFPFRPIAHHPERAAPCFEEYRPLLHAAGGIDGFPDELVFGRYRLGADDHAPRLQAYFDMLSAVAHQGGKLPVFSLVRSALRIAWFRRHLPGVHIVVRRHPRRQFISYLRQAEMGNRYFLERPWVIFGSNRHDPAFAPLRTILGRPADKDAADACDPFWIARALHASLAEHYIAFYFLHLLAMRDIGGNCDLVVDVDRLCGDDTAIAETERRIAALTGAAPSLADCRPDRYDDKLDWSADSFAALESLVEDLLGAAPALARREPAEGEIFQLATRFHHGGLPQCAEPLYRIVLDSEPAHFGALYGAGIACRQRNQFGDADRLLADAVAGRPDSVAALHEHGRVLNVLREHAKAAGRFRQVLAIAPDDAEAHKGLATALIGLGHLDEADAQLTAAMLLEPDCAQIHNNLGTVMMLLKRPDAALARFEAAVALDPDFQEAHHNCGEALLEIGRIAEAEARFETAIALAPNRSLYYRSLAEIRRFAPGDPHLAAMEALAVDIDALAITDRTDLHFALAKALEDTGEHGRAFDHLLRGNAIKRRQFFYDEAAALDELDRIRHVFTAGMLDGGQGMGVASDRPIFIVGMPRSGSTLVEQILAGHPDVFAAGELEDFGQAIDRIDGLRFPDDAAAITARQARQLGSDYLDAIGAQSPAARRVTDKLPGNFRLIGLIRLALPNARIIHTRRNPLDTCVSCFSSLFTGHQPFTYDLGELWRYYRAYAALMRHWREVLPAAAMIEVDYERVVADLAGETRRILAFCDLPWNTACLAFHRTARPVRTRSRSQVRQPLYHRSVGRWQAYGEWLGPLREALETKRR